MFRDRRDAGERLAEALGERGVAPDLVLAIPRGGLPLGRPVADLLGAPLSVVVAKKVGAPSNPDLALAAVAEDGSTWRNHSMIAEIGVSDSYLEPELEQARTAARQKAEQYRDGEGVPTVEGTDVLIVDDGVATGATMRACGAMVREGNPASMVVAAPVAPLEVAEDLHQECDHVTILETPAAFRAVGAYYEHFDQVSDEEARTYLQ